jgi:hypothetical protein
MCTFNSFRIILEAHRTIGNGLDDVLVSPFLDRVTLRRNGDTIRVPSNDGVHVLAWHTLFIVRARYNIVRNSGGIELEPVDREAFGEDFKRNRDGHFLQDTKCDFGHDPARRRVNGDVLEMEEAKAVEYRPI